MQVLLLHQVIHVVERFVGVPGAFKCCNTFFPCACPQLFGYFAWCGDCWCCRCDCQRTGYGARRRQACRVPRRQQFRLHNHRISRCFEVHILEFTTVGERINNVLNEALGRDRGPSKNCHRLEATRRDVVNRFLLDIIGLQRPQSKPMTP